MAKAKTEEAVEEAVKIEVSPRIIKVGEYDVMVQKTDTDKLEFSFWTEERHFCEFEIGDNDLATAILMSASAEHLAGWVESYFPD